jgi:hypothetical protein
MLCSGEQTRRWRMRLILTRRRVVVRKTREERVLMNVAETTGELLAEAGAGRSRL